MDDVETLRAYIDGSYYEDPGGALYQYEAPNGRGARVPASEAVDHLEAQLSRYRHALERCQALSRDLNFSGGKHPSFIEEVVDRALHPSSEKEKEG